MPGCAIEADKLVGTVTFTGGTVKAIDFQSSSTDLLVMDSTTSPASCTARRRKPSSPTPPSPNSGWRVCLRTNGRELHELCYQPHQPKGSSTKARTPWRQPHLHHGERRHRGPDTVGAVRWAAPGTNLMWAAPRQRDRVPGDRRHAGSTTHMCRPAVRRVPSRAVLSGTALYLWHPAPKFTCLVQRQPTRTWCRPRRCAPVFLPKAPTRAARLEEHPAFRCGASW